MDDRCFSLAEAYCRKQYVHCGRENLQSLNRVCRSILAQRRCPEEGLSDLMIEHILTQLSLMDANNFQGHIGGGEREGRIISSLVRRRHYGLAHGIGRSGNLTDAQPKAAGSTLLYNLTNALMLDFLRLAGGASFRAAVCVPMATGMTISLVLRSIAKWRLGEMNELEFITPLSPCPHNDPYTVGGKSNVTQLPMSKSPPTDSSQKPFSGETQRPNSCRFIIWPRIDQKTALKCIESAGFEAVPVSLRPAPVFHCHSTSSRGRHKCAKSKYFHSQTCTCSHIHNTTGSSSASSHSSTHPFFLQVHVEDIASAVELAGGPGAVLCILSTTSCFAPRLPDDVVAISRYAQEKNIPYVVNNAYGTQSRTIMKQIETAQRKYRVDYVIQSGDKNFLVPVGGAIVASSSADLIRRVGALYAGRASASPIVDLFITALHLGRSGMKELWRRREEVWAYMVSRVKDFAQNRRERLVEELNSGCSECLSQKDDSSSSANCFHSLPFRNNISLAVTMNRFGLCEEEEAGSPVAKETGPEEMLGNFSLSAKNHEKQISACKEFGAKLFRSRVTGPRVIIPDPDGLTVIADKYRFRSYGCHQDFPLCPLLVMACGIGMMKEEVDDFMRILEKLWPVVPSKKV